ncbi:hypothetical protein MD484_g5271, partial [Candolleomyces efflorescens]
MVRFKTLDDLIDMGYDEKAIDFLPSYNTRGELTYHLGTVATLAAEYKKKRGDKAKQAWRDEQEQFWANRLEHGLSCRSARKLEVAKEEARKKAILEKFAEERTETIKANLRKLGWEKEVERFFKKSDYRLYDHTYKARPLSDREWAGMLPEITSLMEAEREELRIEGIEALFQDRINKWLKPAFTAFILSRPPNEINPNIRDIALMDEWRTLLCTKPFDEDLKESAVEAASAQIPEFAGAFRKERIELLLDVVRKSKTYSGQEVTEDILQLASTIFRRRSFDSSDLYTYPHVLTHEKNFLFIASPSIQVAPRDAEELPPPEIPTLHSPESPIIRLYSHDEKYILKALESAGVWIGLSSKVEFDDAAHEHMLSLLDALGWSHDTTAEEMEERQPYVECLCECYHDPTKPRSRKVFRWKKAIFECKPHVKAKGDRLWFSKLDENELQKSEQYEEVRHRSWYHQCPWCHNYRSMYMYDSHPRLRRHVSSCCAIQEPCPPEVQEHVKKVTLLADEEPWFHYETSVALEGEQEEACQTCRKIAASEADQEVGGDSGSDSE